MASLWKTVRIFISSTFRDMHAERDHLIKRVFPRVRQWCHERRMHLVDIDLRWGVTKEEADNGAAIDICLKEIDGSRPFFVCILGSRYGWVPDTLPPEEMYAFHGLQAKRNCSITHLEIQHAVGPISQTDGSKAPACSQVFFYFRDPECLPNASSLGKLSDQQRSEYANAFFESPPQPGNPDRRQMLRGLKETLRKRYADDNRIFDYKGRWDAEADNPEDELLKGRLTDLKNFGERVEADLIRGIEEQFAEHIAALDEADDPLASERSAHEAFIENRTQVHVVRSDIEKGLNEYLSGGAQPLILSGPPGSGKSAILAHWVKESWKGAGGRMKSDSGLLVLPRFIGASTNSVSLHRLLGNICEELRVHFQLTEESTGGQGVQPMEIPADPVQVLQKWPKFLEAAAEKGRVVIVLDAINQLDRSADPMRLYWLPRDLPGNVRIIVSALDHGKKAHRESSSSGSTESAGKESSEWLSVLRRMGFEEVPVPELTDDERRAMIKQIPSVFCKTLDEGQINLLLENEATRNSTLR